MSNPMHDDQLNVSLPTIELLVREQFPELTGPIRLLPGSGTVNAIARVGDGVTARFPLRLEPADEVQSFLEAEQAALAELAEVSPFPTPRPRGIGRPGHGYPLPWSLQGWLEGEDGWRADDLGWGTSSKPMAEDLPRLILALRAADTRGRVFTGTGRGGHLRDHEAWMQVCLTETAALVDAATLADLRRLWEQFRELPRSSSPDVMSHQDLIPGNILVGLREGHPRLVGVLDGGGFGPTDPALDLVSAWHLLESGPRQRLREALGCEDLEWERGRGWAFQQAMGLYWYYRTSNPPMSLLGERTLRRLLA